MMNAIELKAVGNRIRIVRERQDLTIAQLENKTGLAATHIRNIENGAKPISITSLVKICNALHADMNYLLCDVSRISSIYALNKLLKDCAQSLSHDEYALISCTFNILMHNLKSV